jgi:putative phosphoesterase
MRVAIISDTHNMIRTELKAYLEGCELILHAGDISKPEILDALKSYAPVYVVRGNNDRQWAEDIPYTLKFELGGINFFMIHKVHDRPQDLRSQGVNVVIYGHTHKYDDHEEDGMRFLNPGSCGPRRFTQPITMMLAEIGDGKIEVEKIEIPHTPTKTLVKSMPPDMPIIVSRAVRDIKRNKSVQEIADRNGISVELSELICRLYLTHPGIDVDGIVRKMGL